MDPLFQSPVVLAKRLATLDRLSGGRLVAGVGQGWMPEEFEAVGVPIARRGAGFEEHLATMRACWQPDPVEHLGRWYRIPRSTIGPKPMKGRVPLLVGGTTRPAVERAARLGDGFAAVMMDWETLRSQVAWFRDAGGAGPIVVRVNPETVDAARTARAVHRADRIGGRRHGPSRLPGADVVVWDLNMADLDTQHRRSRSSKPLPRRSMLRASQ